uniref:Ovule protein n=1 Tax=Heterorhabditis bacteriophora TaxID=37862 RepID=A0A1I7WCU3_HETBA
MPVLYESVPYVKYFSSAFLRLKNAEVIYRSYCDFLSYTTLRSICEHFQLQMVSLSDTSLTCKLHSCEMYRCVALILQRVPLDQTLLISVR